MSKLRDAHDVNAQRDETAGQGYAQKRVCRGGRRRAVESRCPTGPRERPMGFGAYGRALSTPRQTLPEVYTVIRKTLATHARRLCYAAGNYLEDTIDSCSHSTTGTKHHVHPRVSLALSAHSGTKILGSRRVPAVSTYIAVLSPSNRNLPGLRSLATTGKIVRGTFSPPMRLITHGTFVVWLDRSRPRVNS